MSQLRDVNSEDYWNHRFATDWHATEGPRQSRFFAQIAIENLPLWFIGQLSLNELTLVDWGCAQGDGTAVWINCMDPSLIFGVDFSQVAIGQASKCYPGIRFICENWTEPGVSMLDSYDIVFSSNTLEHLGNPYDVLDILSDRANKAVVLMLPYREFNLSIEHLHTFLSSNIPLELRNGFRLAWAKTVDCSRIPGSLWGGEQICLVYASPAWLSSLNLTLSDCEMWYDDLKSDVACRDVEIDRLDKIVAEQEERVVCLNRLIAERDDQITKMKAEIDVVYYKSQSLEASRSWRLTAPLRDGRRWIGSLKRKIDQAFWLARTKGVAYLLSFLWKRNRKRWIPDKSEHYYRMQLEAILSEHKEKPVILFLPVVDWDIPLFQRPQHLAMRLAEQGFLYFFCTPNVYDSVKGFKKVHDGCYVTNQLLLVNELIRQKTVHAYAQDPNLDLDTINKYIESGSTILYEYVDEIHSDIAGCKISEELLHRHKEMLQNEHVICVATAEKLYRDVARYRTDNLALVTNGVDFDHFSVERDWSKIPHEIRTVVEKNKPVIGYFGALAKWFDYELVVKLASQRPEYEILLIGWNYDQSINAFHLLGEPNITVIGPVDYNELPRYACWFDVSTIPFLINAVTESTSPIKLFEYMALGHPIVTTNMPECRKYRSVMIGFDHEDFIDKVDNAILARSDSLYLSLLKAEGLANTWKSKAKDISKMIKLRGSSKCLLATRLGEAIGDHSLERKDATNNNAVTIGQVQRLVRDCHREDGDGKTYYEDVYMKSEVLYWRPVPSWIDVLPKVESVIDVGAAYGTLLAYTVLCLGVQNAHAVDPVGYMSKSLRCGLGIRLHSIDFEREMLDVAADFDLIIFTEVLEHLNFHPLSTLHKLKNLMSSNGRLILTTPDAQEWGRVTKFYDSLDSIPEYIGQNQAWIDDHVWQYSKDELDGLIDLAGFVVEKFDYSPGVVGRHLCYQLSAR